MKRFLFMGLMAAVGLGAGAVIPTGYYNSLDGQTAESLLERIEALSAGHKVVTYNSGTWKAFDVTDVRPFRGKEIYWDMYSNGIVYTGEHGAMNIEHAVANSWWGGKTGSTEAYSDLFLLNPSDAVANGKKSDLPPGEVLTVSFDNGLLKIGSPAEGLGGGASSVFEPADEYKGDFARAYFYVFTAYKNLSNWKSETAYVYDAECRLQPWAVEMLLKWHRADPVDTKELTRNDEIYNLQGNRNPFIDFPELAEYVWGDRQGSTFDLEMAEASYGIDRPEAPSFEKARPVGMDTYTRRWWDGFAQQILHNDGKLRLSIDGREFYEPFTDSVEFDPAVDGDETHIIKAYTEKSVDGYLLRSPIATLTLTGRDPDVTEYTTARWVKLTDDMNVELDQEKWVIISSNNNNAMSWKGSTYLEAAGLVEIEGDYLVELPMDAALVEFERVDGGKYRLMVSDMKGNYKGSWNSTGKNKMKLDADTYTPGTWEGMGDDDSFKFRFDANGSLLFNKTQVRYVNYEDNANQTPVYLYKFVDMEGGMSGIGAVEEKPWAVGVDGSDIIAPEGSVIYDLNGRRVSGKSLGHGVYIVVGPTKTVKIAL